MGFLNWLSKPPTPDYETLLSRLSTEITEAKTHLSEIRLRERRLTLLINAYGLAVWVLWAGLWWVGGLPLSLFGWDSRGNEARFVGGGGVGAGPLVIYGLNRLLHLYYARQRSREEIHLRKLLSQQRTQVEAIKKATNYDSTRKLIERYDENNPSSQPILGPSNTSPTTPTRGQRGAPFQASPSPAGVGSPKGTPRAPGHLVGAGGTPAQLFVGPGTPENANGSGMTPDQQAAALHMQMQAIQPILPVPEKKWYDRVADSILGDDPSQAAQSKYALVCGECFRHNGLVGGKYEWERMQWICPRCNHLNPPPLSRLKSETSLQTASSHSHPSSSSPAPAPAPSPITKPNTRASRQSGERGRASGTPRSSGLRKEVFSVSEGDSGEEGENREDGMEVDEDK